MITHTQLERKIDSVQHQLDSIARESAAFRSYVNKQSERLYATMARKEDLRQFATKDDLAVLTALVIKIAEKVGAAP
jgi:hypothetical protein